MEIRLNGITKSFDKKQVIHPTTLTIEHGSFTTLLGPSGCGKTTLLRMIAGLETPDEGEIWLDDTCVFSKEKHINLPPEKRVIRIYMDMINTQLYISFTNFTAGKKLEKSGNIFKSTKGDGHGFGLVRIDAIVERLGGYLSRNSEDGAFTTEVLLPQVL